MKHLHIHIYIIDYRIIDYIHKHNRLLESQGIDLRCFQFKVFPKSDLYLGFQEPFIELNRATKHQTYNIDRNR